MLNWPHYEKCTRAQCPECLAFEKEFDAQHGEPVLPLVDVSDFRNLPPAGRVALVTRLAKKLTPRQLGLLYGTEDHGAHNFNRRQRIPEADRLRHERSSRMMSRDLKQVGLRRTCEHDSEWVT